MKSQAPTRLSAALSGAALGIGMPLFQAWQSTLTLSDAARRLAFATALALLFFAPVICFVVGIAHLKQGRSDPGGVPHRPRPRMTLMLSHRHGGTP